MNVELIGSLLGAAAGLVAGPTAVMVFYVRGLRDDQRAQHLDLCRRMERIEAEAVRVERAVADVQRAYTTKDEWLRETMLARRQLERVGEVLGRVQADMDNLRGLAAQFGRAMQAIIELADRLGGRCSNAQERVG